MSPCFLALDGACQAQRVLEELFATSGPGPAPVPWGGTPESQEALEALVDVAAERYG